jgi:hypothetical protein
MVSPKKNLWLIKYFSKYGQNDFGQNYFKKALKCFALNGFAF